MRIPMVSGDRAAVNAGVSSPGSANTNVGVGLTTPVRGRRPPPRFARHGTLMTVPHLPAAVGARVHVEGHGLGTYVRFDYNVLSPVLHCIDFDECGEKTFRGDSSCRDRCR